MAGLARTINIARQFSTTALRREGGCVPPGDVRSTFHHYSLNGVKPPNILIYDDGDSFIRMKDWLSRVLKPNLYVIYKLSDRDLRASNWHESTLLLVLRKPPTGKEALISLKYYFDLHKGKIWTASSNDWTKRLMKYFGDDAIGSDGDNKFVVRDPSDCEGSLSSQFLVANFDLQIEENPSSLVSSSSLTSPLSLFGRNKSFLEDFISFRRVDDVVSSSLSSECRLSFKPSTFRGTASSVLFQVIDDPGDYESFDVRKFYEVLKTTRSGLGNIVIHGKVMASTALLTDNIQIHHGLLVIADQQTSGKGRGGNAWLSPLGCSMFTLQIHVPLKSPLGQKLSIIQHLVGTAVAHSLASLRNIQDIRLKWPNDIYLGSSHKLGGILVTSSICGESATLDIGLGLNLDNNVPLPSLNAFLKEKNLPPIGREEFIGETLNSLEDLLIRVNSSMDSLLRLYYKYWLHGDQEVTLYNANSGSNEPGVIKGLDEYGFLIVETSGGRRITVHPDGNSFDMVKGLILPKNS